MAGTICVLPEAFRRLDRADPLQPDCVVSARPGNLRRRGTAALAVGGTPL